MIMHQAMPLFQISSTNHQRIIILLWMSAYSLPLFYDLLSLCLPFLFCNNKQRKIFINKSLEIQFQSFLSRNHHPQKWDEEFAIIRFFWEIKWISKYFSFFEKLKIVHFISFFVLTLFQQPYHNKQHRDTYGLFSASYDRKPIKNLSWTSWRT